jgi:hypothetical protein
MVAQEDGKVVALERVTFSQPQDKAQVEEGLELVVPMQHLVSMYMQRQEPMQQMVVCMEINTYCRFLVVREEEEKLRLAVAAVAALY